MDVRIVVSEFDGLAARTVYDVCRLRQDVFVVEQSCPYPDLDGRDLEPGTRHVVVWADDRVAGYLRLLTEPGGSVRIGRVVLARTFRGQGLADRLVRAALEEIGDRPSVMDAQAPLAGWYSTFGFEVSGPEFLEDGIPHVPMRRP